jgi:signal transduction histidine kinase
MTPTHHRMSLQTKVTLVILLIVGISMASAEVINRVLIGTMARESFREEMKAVVQHIDASITTLADLHDSAQRKNELGKLRASRPDLIQVSLYGLRSGKKDTPVLLARSGKAGSSKFDRMPPLVSQALANALAVSDLQGDGRQDPLKIAAPILVNGKIVGATYAEFSSAKFDKVFDYQRQVSLWRRLITAAIIVIAINLFLFAKVHRPVGTLLSAVEAVADGNLDTTVPVSGKDEIAKLGERFNQMVARIKTATEDNRRLFNELQRSHQGLESRVEEATSEIRQKNLELARTNEGLSSLQRELARAQRLSAIGQLAAMVAHKIGTPLTALSGHIQLLEEDPQLGSEARRRLNTVEAQIERTSRIIQDLLVYARKPEVVLAPLDVNACLGECIALLQPELERRRVAFAGRFGQGLAEVRADHHQLQEVFCNLIENAMDAMPGGGTLTVGTFAWQPQQGEVEQEAVAVEIADTGQGIAPEHLDRIFQPFFTTKKAGRGTGLGLAIAIESIKTHGGEIRVESEVGKGTRFVILLPTIKGDA